MAYTFARRFFSLKRPILIHNSVLFKHGPLTEFNTNKIFHSSCLTLCRSYDSQTAASPRNTSQSRKKWIWGGILVGGCAIAGFTLWKKNNDKSQTEDLLTLTVKRGILATQRSQFDKAQELFHQALEITYSKHKEKLINAQQLLVIQVNIFGSMATAYMKAGDFEKAEKLYKETMQKCIAAGRSTDDESVIELSIKLASLYAGTSQDDKAEAGFKYCVEVMDKAVAREGGLLEADTNTLALQGLAVQSYARFQTKKKNYEEGIKLFKKSLDIAREVYGADHPQALVVLNDLSSAYVVSKNYRLGIESYKEAVERAERKGNMEDSLVAFNYNLAQASILSQECEAATSYCNRCLELANNLKNPSLVKAAEQCLADVKEAVDQKSKEKT